MNQDQREVIEVLREIRDGQQEIIRLLTAQHALTEAQAKRSQEAFAESVALQKLGLQRQRSITLIAVPGILACIAAIVYLVMKYF